MVSLIAKPGPTQVDHPVSSLKLTTVNSLPSKVTQPVDKAGTTEYCLLLLVKEQVFATRGQGQCEGECKESLSD
jgi:hypothetical protein